MLEISRRDKLDDEAGRIEALNRLDAETYCSEASFYQITRLLQIILDSEMVAISLITANQQIMKASQGPSLQKGPRESTFCNIAIRRYEPLIVNDTLIDSRFQDSPFVTGAPFLRSYIGMPLTTDDGYNLGTICAFSPSPRSFTERDSEAVSKCAALVMNLLKLRSQASMDFLTGILNRRSFFTGLKSELARLRRYPGKAVVAFLDIDHFKQVNDSFGHPVGDVVLKEFADIVAGQCRENDLFARLGGEEFAVLLPDTDLDAAYIWAERTRIEVAAAQFNGTDALNLTVSIGLAEFDEQQKAINVITEAADRALYEAKRQGRNRVVS